MYYKRDFFGFLEMAAWGIGGLLVAAFVLMCAAFLLVLLGYGLGLWSAPCAMDASQPHCIAAGWGHHLAITGTLKR